MKGVYLSVASLATLTGNRPSLWYLVSPNSHTHTRLSFKHATNSKQKCSRRGDKKANVMSPVKVISTDCPLLFHIYIFSLIQCTDIHIYFKWIMYSTVCSTSSPLGGVSLCVFFQWNTSSYYPWHLSFLTGSPAQQECGVICVGPCVTPVSQNTQRLWGLRQ